MTVAVKPPAREHRRRLAALAAFPHRHVGRFEVAAEAAGVEQRAARAVAREPRAIAASSPGVVASLSASASYSSRLW